MNRNCTLYTMWTECIGCLSQNFSNKIRKMSEIFTHRNGKNGTCKRKDQLRIKFPNGASILEKWNMLCIILMAWQRTMQNKFGYTQDWQQFDTVKKLLISRYINWALCTKASCTSAHLHLNFFVNKKLKCKCVQDLSVCTHKTDSVIQGVH